MELKKIEKLDSYKNQFFLLFKSKRFGFKNDFRLYHALSY